MWRSRTLQTHHVYSTLKRRGNDRFHVVSTWNTRGVFVGKDLFYDLPEAVVKDSLLYADDAGIVFQHKNVTEIEINYKEIFQVCVTNLLIIN